ncbi:MAG: MCE family protein [Bacteroidales bacterium]|nr:MCE family protein [Bacteroidales bacterium]
MKISRELIVGIIFIITIGLFIWGFNFLKGSDIFEKQREFYVEYDAVNGLIKSNPIVINGLKVGQVKDLYFAPDNSGNIIVILVISNDFPIPKNSIARIYSSDLMGSKAIDLQIGSSKILAQSGDTLGAKVEASLKEEVNAQVQPLKTKAEDLMGSIDSVVTVIQAIFNENARENLENSFESIKNTLFSLQNTTYNIDTLVITERTRLSSIINNVDDITKNLKENNKNISNILANFSTLSDTLAKSEIPKTFLNANKSIETLSKILDKINKGEGTLGLLLHNDSLYIELQKSSSDLNKLLEDIRLNPKKYVRFSVF